jgi:hypothetical protein
VTAPGVYDDFPESTTTRTRRSRRAAPVASCRRPARPSSSGSAITVDLRSGPSTSATPRTAWSSASGMDVVVVQKVAKDGTKADADDYKTRSRQEHRDETYAAGKVPLLAHEWALVKDMAGALRAGLDAAQAGDLFVAGTGAPSCRCSGTTTRHDVDRRARFDWLPDDRRRPP